MMMTGEVKNPQGLATAAKRYIELRSDYDSMTHLIPCITKPEPFVLTVYTQTMAPKWGKSQDLFLPGTSENLPV